MPALKNIRHEKFVQNLAKGMSQTQAYIQAGYSEKGAEVSANRLLSYANVSERLQELKSKAAEKFELTRDHLIKFHMDMMEHGEKHSDRINAAREAGKLIGAYEADNRQRQPKTKIVVE